MLGPTRPGAKQRRTHRPSQPGGARLLNRPSRRWLFWRVSARDLLRRFRFSAFPPCGFGVGAIVFFPTGGRWAPTPTRPRKKRRKTKPPRQPTRGGTPADPSHAKVGPGWRRFRNVFLTPFSRVGLFGGFLFGVFRCGFVLVLFRVVFSGGPLLV